MSNDREQQAYEARMREISEVRAELDLAIEAALPFAGGRVLTFLELLQEELARTDRLSEGPGR